MNVETFQVNFQIVAIAAIMLSVLSLLFVWIALIGPFKGKLKKLIGEKLFVERFFLLIITLLGLVIIAIAAFCVGVYIKYGQMENIWDVISTIASWFGVAASISAVWFAVRVADKQNKIALFEKRYEIYRIIFNCRVFAELLKLAKSGEDIQLLFLSTFFNNKMGEKINDSHFISTKYIFLNETLHQAQFLFENQKV